MFVKHIWYAAGNRMVNVRRWAVVVLCTLGSEAQAHADESSDGHSDGLVPVDARSVDAPLTWNTVGVLRATDPLGTGNASVQLFSTYRTVPRALDAAARPMVLGEIAAAFGVSNSVSVGISLPVLVRGYGVYGVPLSALGDARFVLSHSPLIPGPIGPGFSWTVGLRAPTGDRASGIAYASTAVLASAHGEIRLGIADVLGHLGVTHAVDHAASSAGAVRAAPSSLVDGGFGLTARLHDLVRAAPEHIRLELAVTGRKALAGSNTFDAAFLHLSQRFYLDRDDEMGLVLGLAMAVSGTPEASGTLGFRYAPRLHDRDGDGVPDRLDQCPELEEDRDGFEDSDGCPEIDNDGDDVSDEDDKCPNEAGDAEAFGCPAPPVEANPAEPETGETGETGLAPVTDSKPTTAPAR